MIKAGIYIHIPFCKVKCIYCDYYSIIKQEKDMSNFVDMLIREIEMTALNYKDNWTFDTIFFGGGTPSLMEPIWMEKILQTLDHFFNFSTEMEITLEANPGEAPIKKLKEFHKIGINRLSLGFQSLQKDLLTSLSRIHSIKDCFDTFNNARNAGFENINVDMLFNIPRQSTEIFQDDMKKIIKLEPEHISAYSLTVERNTPLFTNIRDGMITMPSEKIDLEMFEFCQNYLDSVDFNQYEISSYAKPDMECRHNLHYWNLEPYLAFGPSAHGYDGHNRWWNTPSFDIYMQMLSRNEIPITGSEKLSQRDHFNEVILNGLRTRGGIQLRKIHAWKMNPTIMNPTILKWKSKLDVTEDTISLKSNSYKYADEIASDMLQT